MTYIVLTSEQWARLKSTAARVGDCTFAVSMAQPGIAAAGSPEHDMQIAVGDAENASQDLSRLVAEIEASNGT